MTRVTYGGNETEHTNMVQVACGTESGLFFLARELVTSLHGHAMAARERPDFGLLDRCP